MQTYLVTNKSAMVYNFLPLTIAWCSFNLQITSFHLFVKVTSKLVYISGRN